MLTKNGIFSMKSMIKALQPSLNESFPVCNQRSVSSLERQFRGRF